MSLSSVNALMRRLFVLQNRVIYVERRMRILLGVVVISFSLLMMYILTFLAYRLHAD